MVHTQQTRNHFWTSWHMLYWFIIGTDPPVGVFLCFTSFERVWHELYWVSSGTVSSVRVITWKTRDFTINTCRYTKFVHRIWLIHVQKHVNWASWTREFTYRTCEITGRCLLGTHNFQQCQRLICDRNILVWHKSLEFLASCIYYHKNNKVFQTEVQYNTYEWIYIIATFIANDSDD